jgi:two-component system sensor histidine kinase BaeS
MEARFLIAGTLTLGIFLSAVLGVLLALNISHPIIQVTQMVFDLARGNRAERLPEQGPTEIKTLEEATNFLVSRLKDLEQSRRQLLANLVHELGRPLGALRTGIQVLRRGAKDDPQILDELLEGMETETAVLGRVVEDLSHLHDQVIGALELDLQTVPFSKWLPTTLSSAREAAHRKGLEWVIDVPEDLPEMKIDPQRMAQAIGNLTANAIKYSSRGGTVSVAAGEKEQMVWIRVSDTGPGISLEEQEKIFEPFFRGTQRQRIKQGMGLGLSIAQNFVTAHHGRLEVDSTPGLGSHFTIWLPKSVDISHLSSYDKQLAVEK